MTKMIFAVHNLWINTKKQSVTELSSWTEIREFERPESVENFFQFIADKMAEEWCGSDLFVSPWMKAEYINSGYTLTAKYRLYGDSNESPQYKIFDRVLLVTAIPLLV